MIERSWYALYTNANAEKRVWNELTGRGVEAWLPSVQEVHRWSDRRKTVDRLIFPGYVFVRIADTAEERVRVLQAQGAVRILGSSGRIEAIPEAQIESLRGLVRSGAALAIYGFLQSGTPVRVKRGPLAGLEGELVRVKNAATLVVSIELLSQSVATEIDICDVEALSAARRVA